jgi:hypothetical protein
MTFEITNNMWLFTRHFRTTSPSKQLDYQCTGPYTVSKIIKKNSYNLDLAKTMPNQNVV